MPNKLNLATRWLLLATVVLGVACPVFGAGTKTLHGHVPDAARRLTPMGRLTATNELRLAIGVPLRDLAGLEKFLAEVYDPTNPNYRRFLTPEGLTVRFGPTAADYEAVKQFALASGFKITGTHDNRLLLDVTGSAPDMPPQLTRGTERPVTNNVAAQMHRLDLPGRRAEVGRARPAAPGSPVRRRSLGPSRNVPPAARLGLR